MTEPDTAPPKDFWTQDDTIRQVIAKLNAKEERRHDLSGVHYVPDQDSRMAVWVVEALAAERDALKARAEAAEAQRDESLNQLDSAIHSISVLERRVGTLLRAAYDSGYAAGLEAAADLVVQKYIALGHYGLRDAIRELKPEGKE